MSTIELTAPPVEGASLVLTGEALEFVADLQRRFRPRRNELLAARQARAAEISRTCSLDFLPETASIREAEWQVAGAPADLVDRRVEITCPTDAKMTINALNSGAKVWLADLEDANTPHWRNVVDGQVNLYQAIRGTLSYKSPAGKDYTLGDERATIVMRPRGWHMDERHLIVDDCPSVAALVDFGLYFFHNAKVLISSGSGPYFYLPKMESHLEARLWRDVFTHAEATLGLPYGTTRATALIETIPAAFEMEEILYELRDHASGLNAGRWDYLFSIIKKFSNCGAEFVLPDRGAVTMNAPFMRAYSELLVKTCHKRGAFAIGGMAAFIPSRRDAGANASAFAKVREDKTREATAGFDGTWVAHPDLVPVSNGVFDPILGNRPNQLDLQRDDVTVTAKDLLAFSVPDARITEAGLRSNVEVSVLYLAYWINGTGAVGIHNLMEDAATAEISRSQIWQWICNGAKLDSGETVTAGLVTRVLDEEMPAITRSLAAEPWAPGALETARKLFTEVVLAPDFVEFITIPAYAEID